MGKNSLINKILKLFDYEPNDAKITTIPLDESYREVFKSYENSNWEELHYKYDSHRETTEEISFTEQIIQFYKPYDISVFKHNCNEEFFIYHYNKFYDFKSSIIIDEPNRAAVSPSLIRLITQFRVRYFYYPMWFAVSFPDVVHWALNEGRNIIDLMFADKHICITNNPKYSDEFNVKYLKIIVDKYLSTTNRQLEASHKF